MYTNKLNTKDQLSVFVSLEIGEQIRSLAKERNVSIGLLGGQYLEHGFKGGEAENHVSLILPTLEHRVSKLMRNEFSRQTYFLVRLLLEVNALRRQVYSGQLDTGGQAKAKAAFDRSYENSVKTLKKRLPEVAELISLLEAAGGGLVTAISEP